MLQGRVRGEEILSVTDRQAERQSVRQTDRRTISTRDRQTERQSKRKSVRQTVSQTVRKTGMKGREIMRLRCSVTFTPLPSYRLYIPHIETLTFVEPL